MLLYSRGLDEKGLALHNVIQFIRTPNELRLRPSAPVLRRV